MFFVISMFYDLQLPPTELIVCLLQVKLSLFDTNLQHLQFLELQGAAHLELYPVKSSVYQFYQCMKYPVQSSAYNFANVQKISIPNRW